jgi:predicted PurR-regulated permease PerM
MVVIASLIGIGIGVLISPLLDYLQRWLKLRRSFCAFFLIIGMLICTAIIGGLIGWVIFEQGSLLMKDMPEFSAKLRAQLENIFDRFPWILERIKGFDFVGTLQGIGQYLLGGIQLGFAVIGGVLFAIIIGIYLAIDSDSYFRGSVRAFPPQHRDRAQDLLKKCAYVIRVWFRAQLIDMAIIGLITTIGLLIVGVKFWALFGLLTALFGIIPYLGVMIVVVMVSLITLASDPSQVPWVLLVFTITQLVEGNLVLPWVMKGQAEIPEALLLIVMLFFGFWFGLIGVFIAPPLVAVMICLYRNLYITAIETRHSPVTSPPH